MQGKPVRTNPISLNPFSLMMEPETVLQAMEHSKSLGALRRRQLRPLDKPLIPYAASAVEEVDDEAETIPGYPVGH